MRLLHFNFLALHLKYPWFIITVNLSKMQY